MNTQYFCVLKKLLWRVTRWKLHGMNEQHKIIIKFVEQKYCYQLVKLWIILTFTIVSFNISEAFAASEVSKARESFIPSIVTVNVTSNSKDITIYNNDAGNIEVFLFLSSTCENCQKATNFFQNFQKPWLKVTKFYIDKYKSDLILFNKKLELLNDDNFAVPSIIFCNSRWTGFDSSETTGKLLASALEYCHLKVLAHHHLTKSTTDVLDKWAEAAKLGLSLGNYSTISIAINDLFNSCSLFFLVTCFVVLWLCPTRKIQLFAALSLLISFGLAHYLHQSYLSYLYQYSIVLRFCAILTGSALLFLLLKNGKETFEHLWILIPVAMVIEFYQQSCQNNFVLVYEQWLQIQHLSFPRAIINKLFYYFIYLLPLTTIAFLSTFLGNRQWFGKYRSSITKICLYYLIFLGLNFIFAPITLSYLLFSWLIIIMMMILVILRAKIFHTS